MAHKPQVDHESLVCFLLLLILRLSAHAHSERVAAVVVVVVVELLLRVNDACKYNDAYLTITRLSADFALAAALLSIIIEFHIVQEQSVCASR